MRSQRRLVKRFSAVVTAAALVMAIGAAGASATTVGQDFTPNVSCLPKFNLVQSGVATGTSYVVPASGTLTKFTTSVFDGATLAADRGMIALIVEHPVGGGNYTIVGLSAKHR